MSRVLRNSRSGIVPRIGLKVNRHGHTTVAMYDDDEMYDLVADPFETHSLLSDPGLSDVRSDLRRRLADHIRTHAGRPPIDAGQLLKLSRDPD